MEDAFNTVAFGDGAHAHGRLLAEPELTDAVARGDVPGFPFLLISEESLAALNRELPEQLPMARFRPNIVVASAQQGSEGAMPYQEDAWGLIQIGSHLMHVVKPCTRCKLTTVDPVRTAPVWAKGGLRAPDACRMGGRPRAALQTRSRSRRCGACEHRRMARARTPPRVTCPPVGWRSRRGEHCARRYFGQNCLHQSSSGAIHVGDPLRVLQPAKEELALRPVA